MHVCKCYKKLPYVETIIKCRYRLTYMLILLLINLVVFLKWDHVDSNKSLINPG